MITVKTYISDNVVTLVASKKDNAHLEQDLYSNTPLEKMDIEEATQAFLDDAQLDIEETTFKTYTLKDVKSKSTKDLIAFQAKTTNLAALEMTEDILLGRQIDFQPRFADELERLLAGFTRTEELASETEETEPQAKKDEPKTPRKLLKEYSEEELQAVLAECRTRKGLICTFTCRKYGDQLLTGHIKSARLDRRSGFIQYRIETEVNGAKETLGCAHNSKTLTITSAYHTDGLTEKESAAVEEASSNALEAANETK